jgi:hypothetical protein
MLTAALVSLATSVPPHVFLQKDVLAAAWDGFGSRFPEFERFASIFSNTGIIKRHAVKPFDWYLEPRTWPERTAAFLEGAEALFVDVAEKALAAPPGSQRQVWKHGSPAAWVSGPTRCACRSSVSAAPAEPRACRSRRDWRGPGPAPTCYW